MVVTLHVGTAEEWASNNWGTRFVFLFLSNATVPFMFVSGFLFQHLSGQFEYATYLRSRLSKLIVPYVIVSTPSLAYQYFGSTGVFDGAAREHPVRTVIWAYLTGSHMAIPLWYIPVIVLFTLGSPLWVMIDRRPRWYFFIIPGIALSAFIHRPQGHLCVLQSAIYFLPVYLAGMSASHFRAELLEFTSRRQSWLVCATCALLGFEYYVQRRVGPIYSCRAFSTDHGVFDLDILGKLFLTILLIEFLRRYDRNIRGWLAGFADASFGIFFLHEYFIIGLRCIARSFHQALSHPGITLIVISVPVVIASTFLAVIGAQKLLGQRSRFVIGS